MDGHAYAVMGFNEEYKALKLYDPRCYTKICVSNEKVPLSVTEDADANKGELWVTLDQLEKREVRISCLHSENMYKEVFQIKRKISLCCLAKNSFMSLHICKVFVEETSTFMINFFSYSHVLRYINLNVTRETVGKRKYVNVKYELPNNWSNNETESTSKYFQRFKLKPNTYVFSLDLRLSNDCLRKEELNFLMKISSVSKCTFKELHLKAKQFEFCNIL